MITKSAVVMPHFVMKLSHFVINLKGMVGGQVLTD